MTDNQFKAAIFDLDGVVTKTALVHSKAWKTMFDEYLMARSRKTGEPFDEFAHGTDYLPYVDGKPRYKGVESFLQSRGIQIPFGNPDDSPDSETVCGLGNRKDQVFNTILNTQGIQVFDSTLKLIGELLASGIRVAIASSSKNCENILKVAGLEHLFEVRIDGVVSAELGLKGKPEPDIFIVACDRMGIPYDQAVIFEDAVSGVEAGRKGNFGLIVGIAREDNHYELKLNGADIVVSDLSGISMNTILDWFSQGMEDDSWKLSYFNYDETNEKTREVLLATGNGYCGTRGAMEEAKAGKVNYPGTYIAGLYNRLVSKVGGQDVENEDFVNVPNWLYTTYKIEGICGFIPGKGTVQGLYRSLDFRNGVLSRELEWRDETGRKCRILSRRLSSMENPHICAMEYSISPLNYSGTIELETGIDGNIINAGVERYKQLNQEHIRHIESLETDGMINLVTETVQSGIRIYETAYIRFYQQDKELQNKKTYQSGASISQSVKQFVKQGETLKFVKFVSIYTSKDTDVKSREQLLGSDLAACGSFERQAGKNATSWKKLWDKCDIQLSGDRLASKLLRLHMYHLLVAASPHNELIDASITARGLHGEAYRGHIFWDELFILPFYNIHFPEVTKATLLYRYRRLGKAIEYARSFGYSGAMFPWQSGSDGREETQVVHLNPLTGEWGPDYSSYQRHVSLAIAYDVWMYYHTSSDLDFLEQYGAGMFFEICRFWASKAKLDQGTGRYYIDEVMGPDEFHEKYPDSDNGGIKDNAYTNLMVAWTFKTAKEIRKRISPEVFAKLSSEFGIKDEELENWKNIASKLNLVIRQDGIIAQYDGYFDLHELDWNDYRGKYKNIYRLDRILKAEGKSADDYKVAKQADTLMTFYNLNPADVDVLLDEMDYHLPVDYLSRNLEFYLNRTSHGSTLSRVVHAHLANMAGHKDLSWQLYLDALTSDYNDIQGGTTAEGIHAGVMAGTIWVAIESYAGLNLKGEIISIEPCLPEHWRSISFNFEFKQVAYSCTVTKEYVRLKQVNPLMEAADIVIKGRKISLNPMACLEVKY